MPATPQPPFHRFGIRFTSDPTHNMEYLQALHDESEQNTYRGELFLNEALDEIYYTDGSGVVRRFGDRTTIPFTRINFSGIREFDDDMEASEAVPPVPVGGMYRTGGTLKIRLV